MSVMEDNMIEFMSMIDFINKFLKFVAVVKFNDDNDNFGKTVVSHKYIDECTDLADPPDCSR